jgi:putative transposase
MPRPLRYDVVGVPQHVIQRGVNRQRTFFSRRDCHRYLGWLARAARECACEVHAYVLMTNHVHLLVTPQEPMAIAAMMQSLGRRYVRYVNGVRDRTGTLWEGRYKASLVATGSYLWACYRYIELNPVRAGMVAAPGHYRWSSFHRNFAGRHDPVVIEHPEYTELGDDVVARAAVYGRLFDEGLEDATVRDIRQRLDRCDPYGSEAFKRELETGQLGVVSETPKTPNAIKRFRS